ncbi:MAG: cardiolipin synthase, partial [Eubacterium sp.]|nr:cardiolipin synthase [Eubacterium sp.]
GVCGTINLDYRSLYHHFENACVIYECDAVLDIKRDFEKDFKLCNEITEEYAQERSVVMRILDMILRLFAPLL